MKGHTSVTAILPALLHGAAMAAPGGATVATIGKATLLTLSASAAGPALVAVLAATLMAAFLYRVIFEPVREDEAVTDLGALRDPVPAERWRQRGSGLLPPARR